MSSQLHIKSTLTNKDGTKVSLLLLQFTAGNLREFILVGEFCVFLINADKSTFLYFEVCLCGVDFSFIQKNVRTV